MPRFVLALSAALLFMTLAACSSNVPLPDDSGPGSPVPTPTTGVPADLAYQPLDKGQLVKGLLETRDMPPGYAEDADDSANSSKTYCDYEAPAKELVIARRDFIKGGGYDSEAAALILRQYRTTSEARQAFDALAAAMQSCRNETIDGVNVSHAVMSTPKLDHPSIGIRTESDEYVALSNFALVGPTLVSAATAGITQVDADEAAELLVKQVDRYVAVAAPR